MKKIFAILSALVIFISSCGAPEPPSGETETTASANSVMAASARILTEAEPTEEELAEDLYNSPEKYVPTVFSENTDITDKITIAAMRSEVRRKVNKAANAPIMRDDAAKVTSLELVGCNLTEIAGLEYFHNLKSLNVTANQLTALPPLPETLTYLACGDNLLTNLPLLPDTLTYLNCYENQLTYLPNLPKSLETLYCEKNKLVALPELPDNLVYLYCQKNRIEALPQLPETIEFVRCTDNYISSLPNLPESLTYLACGNNKIAALPILPDTLLTFECVGNPIANASIYTRDNKRNRNNAIQNTYTPSEPATPPAPKPEPVPFPVIDGSTSTIALDAYFHSKIRDISLWDAKRETNHSKIFAAFENLVNGKADIVLSVPLAKEQEEFAAENGFEYEAVPVAMEGFVFLVNPKNPVQSLTQAQLRDIYSGKITNWKELGGNDAPIEAYQRNGDSGSQTYMVEFMGDVPLTTAPKSLVQIDMGGVISMFSDYDNSINAIGYSVYSYAAAFAANEGTFNFVEVDGVKPSRTTFIDGTYPLLSETYAFYEKDTTDKVVKDYIDLITSEKGQHYVLEAGYIPVMDIEIPTAYTLYEAKGTGANAPEKTDNNYYYLNFNDDYKRDIRPRGFLKDTAFEAEIQAWIDEAEEYYENMPKSEWESENYTCQYYAEIRNGYLGISVGLEWCDGVGAFEEFHGLSAVFDLYNKKQIENLSDMFYKDADFMPEINSAISTEIMNKNYGAEPIEFFGLCNDFTFNLHSINMKPNNAYVDKPASFYLLLYSRDNSVVSQCRDFTDLITPEFTERIHFVEPKGSTAPYESHYEKNGNVYSYYEYSGVENSRDLPENKMIEEMYDAYFAEHDGDTTYKQVDVEEPFVHLYIGSDGPGEVYCTLQHKFITVGDFFKDGFVEHLTIETNTNDGKNKTAEDLYEEIFAEDNWYSSALAAENIVKQLTDEYKDDYIIISGSGTIELRIDEKWLKNVYRDLPINE